MVNHRPPGDNTSARRYLIGVSLVLALLGGVFLSACSAGESLGNLIGGGGGGADMSSEIPADSEERANPGNPRDNTPQILVAEQPGTAAYADDRAVLDYSNAASGYICAMSYLGDTKVKVLVDAPDGNQYQYTITSSNSYITIPLSKGNGTYSVGVYENLYDDKYAAVFAQDVGVELSDEFGAFLYPNPFVEFSSGDAAVQLSQEVTTNATSDVEAVDQIYMYMVQNFTYDYDKASSVAPGYMPNNDDMLASGEGICFDFASLTASMLRAQRLPTKLDVGYCGQAYHAWIEVYTTDKGWIRKKIEFSGSSWVRLDPTFDSANQGQGDITKVIGDGKNYQPIFYY
jgi:hypothetical protein